MKGATTEPWAEIKSSPNTHRTNTIGSRCSPLRVISNAARSRSTHSRPRDQNGARLWPKTTAPSLARIGGIIQLARRDTLARSRWSRSPPAIDRRPRSPRPCTRHRILRSSETFSGARRRPTPRRRPTWWRSGTALAIGSSIERVGVRYTRAHAHASLGTFASDRGIACRLRLRRWRRQRRDSRRRRRGVLSE